MSNNSVQTVSTSGDKLKVVLAVSAVIAGVFAFYFLSDKSSWIRLVALMLGLAVGLSLAAISDQGREFLNFAKESVREAKKVVWPTRKEATQVTLIVFGFVLVMAIFLWGTDKLLEFLLYDLILNWKS